MLGIEFNLHGPDNNIQLCQRKFAEDILNKYQMMDLKPSPIPATPHLSVNSDMAPKDPQEIKEMETQPFQEMLGSLRYLVSCTRPDLCYIIGYLSRFMQNPGKPHLDALLQVFQYLKSTTLLGLSYKRQNHHDLQLQGWCDADYNSDKDTRHSTTGYVFTIAGGAISWKSKKQNTVALSSTEAEFIAPAYTAKEGVWLQRLLFEFLAECTTRVCTSILPKFTSGIDNQSCITLLKVPKHHENTKHIDYKYFYVKELIEGTKEDQSILVINYTPTNQQVVNPNLSFAAKLLDLLM